jgi:hypothetical protein
MIFDSAMRRNQRLFNEIYGEFGNRRYFKLTNNCVTFIKPKALLRFRHTSGMHLVPSLQLGFAGLLR